MIKRVALLLLAAAVGIAGAAVHRMFPGDAYEIGLLFGVLISGLCAAALT